MVPGLSTLSALSSVQGVKDEADPTRLMRCESAMKWDPTAADRAQRVDVAQGNSVEVGSQQAPIGTIFMSISDALSEGCSIFWRDPTWVLIHTIAPRASARRRIRSTSGRALNC
jgi:hypothetical protein